MATPAAGQPPDPRIVALMKDIEKNKDSKLVSNIDDIIAILFGYKQAWKQRIPPRRVGTDVDNRGGFGVSAIEVHALGAEIVEMGWSWAACEHATAFQDSFATPIALFSVQQQKANPGLGEVDVKEIQFGSLACSHTNQFLIAVIGAVSTEYDCLSVDGRMSRAKLAAADSKLADALENGLNWTVISAEVRDLYPELPALISEARNATGRAQRKKSEIEMLVDIQSAARASSKANNGSVEWDKIAAMLKKRCNLDGHDVDVYLKYIQKYGGGDAGHFVKELDAFKKVYVPSGRVVPLSTFASIVDMRLEAHELSPFFASAIIKTQGSCPKAKAPNGICRFISSSDISALSGNKKKSLLEAETVLREARDIISNSKCPVDSIPKMLGRLDTMMVRHVMQKDSQFASISDVAVAFMHELNKLLKAHEFPEVPSKWKASSQPCSGAAASSSQTPLVPNFVQYDADGKAKDAHELLLKSRGRS